MYFKREKNTLILENKNKNKKKENEKLYNELFYKK